MATLADLKRIACEAIDSAAGDLHGVSKAIWAKPELAFNEHSAHDVLCDFLQQKGFPVERKFHLETAFRASYGDGTSAGLPHVAVLSEYDALPEIGHACGHNLIAEVGVGAGVGIKAALMEAEKQGKKLGKVTVLGTPAEEAAAAKMNLIQAGVFESIDIAMMAHPCPKSVTREMMIASLTVNIKYLGRACHASAAPWMGLNALDAAVMAYNNVSCLRQQMKPTWRVHGVITNGGTKPNIIPEETEMQYYVRAPTMGELKKLKEKMISCFEAAATATGCTVELSWDPNPYENMMTNETLASLYDVNALQVGVEFCKDEALLSQATGSTDMGNVSHVIPSIHPMFYIGSPEINHTRGFTKAAGADVAQGYTLQQAKALAMTALDVLMNPELMKNIHADFEQDKVKDAMEG